MSEKNAHVEEFLKHYCNLQHPPQYALLIKGAWGTGKTHLVKRILEGLAPASSKGKAKPHHLYVSLYGMTKFKEIEEAFFEQLHPALSSKGMKLGIKIFKDTLKSVTKIDLEGAASLPAYLTQTKGLPLVFDDLERCSIKIEDILGYINAFVEHDDYKVIVLGDEEKILQKDDGAYSLIKEKLIGKTFEVRAEFEEAFDHFLKVIDNTAIREFYQSKSSDIRLLFDQSETQNLRTLQRTMWDFERFAMALTEIHRACDEAMRDIFRVFFALSFEIKAGRLNGGEIAEFGQYYWSDILSDDEDTKSTTTEKLKKRYPEVPFDQTLLSHEILADVLGNSIIDTSKIYESLDQHVYFVSPEQEPTWRILWDATRRDQDIVSKSLTKFEDQFKKRQFIVIGEILQVIGLRLWLSDIGAIQQTRVEVSGEVKAYIDDLYKKQKLAIDKETMNEFDLRFGWAGLGFREIDSTEFKELVAYLREKQKIALKDSYPDKAKILMKEMAEDADLFFQRLCINNSDKQLYYDVPILTNIPPNDFVDQVLALSPHLQDAVLSVFKSRYGHHEVATKLIAEMPWLQKVATILKERASEMAPIARHGIESSVNWYIQPALDKYSGLKGGESV